jgi:flagellar biosynthesis/type III secretory pathway protein FliH
MYYLKNNTIPDGFKDPGLKEARKQLKYDNLSEQEKQDYKHYLKQQRYEENSIETAKLKGQIEGEEIGEARGLEKGKAEGEAERLRLQNEAEAAQAKAEAAQAKLKGSVLKSHRKGLSVETIADITGFTEDEITEILKQHKLI